MPEQERQLPESVKQEIQGSYKWTANFEADNKSFDEYSWKDGAEYMYWKMQEEVEKYKTARQEQIDFNTKCHEANAALTAQIKEYRDWRSVEQFPLFTIGELGWEATEDGNKEFLAAVPTNKGWWIRHCVLQDETGLCVVGDDDNEPAGWDMKDVTHWKPILINIPQP